MVRKTGKNSKDRGGKKGASKIIKIIKEKNREGESDF